MIHLRLNVFISSNKISMQRAKCPSALVIQFVISLLLVTRSIAVTVTSQVHLLVSLLTAAISIYLAVSVAN